MVRYQLYIVFWYQGCDVVHNLPVGFDIQHFCVFHSTLLAVPFDNFSTLPGHGIMAYFLLSTLVSLNQVKIHQNHKIHSSVRWFICWVKPPSQLVTTEPLTLMNSHNCHSYQVILVKQDFIWFLPKFCPKLGLTSNYPVQSENILL